MKKFITIMVLALAAMLMVSCLGFNLATVQSVKFEEAPKVALTLSDLKDKEFSVVLNLHMTDGSDQICTAKIEKINTDIIGDYNVTFSTSDTTTLTATANIAKKANMENWYVLTITFDTFVSITHEFYAAENLDLYYFAGGNGDEGDPYQITNAQQLSNIRYALDKNFILMNNIDISDMQWTPIGNGHRDYYTNAKAFKGTFDGNGKTINGLSNKNYAPDAKFIGKNSANENDFGYGLFGSTDGATIKNLTLTNVNINLANEFIINGIEGKVYSGAVGAVVGQAFNSIILENVNVGTKSDNSVIIARDAVGSFIGRLYKETTITETVLLKDCNTYANLTLKGRGGSKLGGFIGYISSNGTFAGKQQSYNGDSSITIKSCNNEGSIKIENTSDGKCWVSNTMVLSSLNPKYNLKIEACEFGKSFYETETSKIIYGKHLFVQNQSYLNEYKNCFFDKDGKQITSGIEINGNKG